MPDFNVTAIDPNKKYNRVEVIDHTKDGKGRYFVSLKPDQAVEMQVQDAGNTLKIFISQK